MTQTTTQHGFPAPLELVAETAERLRAFVGSPQRETPPPEQLNAAAVGVTAEAQRAKSAQRVLRLARMLDDQFEIPVLGRRFGWDAVIGLVPVVGDLATAALSGALVYEAYRAGVPKTAVAKMLGRVAADAAIGSIPVVGDAFDVFFRANRANARTAMKHLVPRTGDKA